MGPGCMGLSLVAMFFFQADGQSGQWARINDLMKANTLCSCILLIQIILEG